MQLLTRQQFAALCHVAGATISEAVQRDLAEALRGRFIDADHPAALEYFARAIGTGPPKDRRGKPGTPSARQEARRPPDVQAKKGTIKSPAGDLREDILAEILAWIEAGGDAKPIPVSKKFGLETKRARYYLVTLAARGMIKPRTAGRPPNSGAPGPLPVDAPGADESIDRYLDMTVREIRSTFGGVEALTNWITVRKQLEDIRGREIMNAEREAKVIPRELVRAHVFGALDTLTGRLLLDVPRTLAARVLALLTAGEGLEKAEAMIREVVSVQIKNAKAEIVKAIGQ